MLNKDLFGAAVPADAHGSALAATWEYPPFSVLNARDGWWQERKRAWLSLGIKSELGRGDILPGGGGQHTPRRVGVGANTPRIGKGMADGLIALRAIQKADNGIRAHIRPRLNARRAYRGGGGQPLKPSDFRAGTFQGGAPDTIRNASFYADKRELERELTIGEFRELTTKKKGGGLAIQTAAWVNQKIADGDIEGGMSSQQSGTSIFDPVICELTYRWFSPHGGVVLDPFAGGSVRGIVASHLGREYHGVELRSEQVAANKTQSHIAKAPAPNWYEGDSKDIAAICPVSADLVFSCPPYGDLERYSDDPRDLSAMDYPTFLDAYRAIIAASCGLLKPDRFACFVVGDIRDKKGNYRNFVGDTVEAFRAAGLHYYNEAILITAVGSLPIRVNKQFQSGRKLGKTHQNILVFVKGDGKKAATACGGNA